MKKNNYSIAGILASLKIEALNDMQLAALEAIDKDQDLILLSSTGSGKTLGFLLPILGLLDPGKKGTQALIIVPSRELAIQIETVFKSMQTGFKVTACFGGHLRETEENNLVEAPALIIGTTGRLADHMRRGNIKVETIETLVLDEFDKILELGFQEELSFILQALPAIRKKILTSATNAPLIPGYIGLHEAIWLNFLSGTATDALSVQMLKSPDKDKLDSLFKLICFLGNRSVIVFCNHREAVERTSKLLADKGIPNVYYHGALEQKERENALGKFRNGSSNILVTTDLASRGLDIPNIRYIIHYHLPLTEEIYTHRNGRTARMEASGTAILLIGPEEKIPGWISRDPTEISLPEEVEIPEKPKWTTLFFSAGKKDKLNKIDIVGFLTNKGNLKKEDIGLIDVKDFFSFAAIRKSKASHTLQLIKEQKIKNKKISIHIAK